MICLPAIHHLVYFTSFKLRKGLINYVEIVENPHFKIIVFKAVKSVKTCLK